MTLDEPAAGCSWLVAYSHCHLSVFYRERGMISLCCVSRAQHLCCQMFFRPSHQEFDLFTLTL